MSNSTMLPTYKFVGLKPYFDLWSNQRWKIAYGNLFYFSAFYVVLCLAVGAAAAIMMLAALAVVLVPYALWTVWRSRREAVHG